MGDSSSPTRRTAAEDYRTKQMRELAKATGDTLAREYLNWAAAEIDHLWAVGEAAVEETAAEDALILRTDEIALLGNQSPEILRLNAARSARVRAVRARGVGGAGDRETSEPADPVRASAVEPGLANPPAPLPPAGDSDV